MGTHFWNTQESYFTYSENEESEVDPNILFRPGIGVDGSETFTPRTLIYDLKGGFGTLRQYNALYEASQDAGLVQGLWDGNTVAHRQPTIPAHQYQQSLELGEPAPPLTADSVRYWSDFNRVFFHPKSIVQLNEYELNSQILPFENWAAGEDLFRDIDKEVDILDRDLRPFAEECDQISALQIFTGADDAWGGFASSYIDNIRDEYGKVSLWTFGLEENQKDRPRRERLLRSENAARTLHSIASQSSAYIRIANPAPIIPSYVHLLQTSDWYTSALTGMAIESLTFPTRCRVRRSNIADFEAILNVEGNQNIHELSAKVAITGQNQLNDCQNGTIHRPSDSSHELDIRFAPEINDVTSPSHGQVRDFGQVLVSRGSQLEANGANEGIKDSETVIERFSFRTPFPLLDSFPRDLLRITHPPSAVNIKSALTTTSKTQTRIEALQRIVGFSTAVEDRETLYSGLASLAEAYDSGWASDGTDEDD